MHLIFEWDVKRKANMRAHPYPHAVDIWFNDDINYYVETTSRVRWISNWHYGNKDQVQPFDLMLDTQKYLVQ